MGRSTVADVRIELVDVGRVPRKAGEITFTGGAFVMEDAGGQYDPRTGSGGISAAQHESLDTLTHEMADDAYIEVTRASGRVVTVTWWADASKARKLRERTITRAAGRVSQVVTAQYDIAGAVVAGQTMTETINRAGGRVASITAQVA